MSHSAPDRKLYQNDVDFPALALQYPEFRQKLKSNGQLDFSDPESVRLLTTTLLKRDFALRLELPEDRLCPPVPNRFNYILWLHGLLDSSSADFRERYDPSREVIGLDIMLEALVQAAYTLFWAVGQGHHGNGLQLVNPADPLLPSSMLKNIPSLIDFTMMNPPFYSSADELMASAKSKSRPPNSACTGAEVEMIYSPSTDDGNPGGEVGFAVRLLNLSALPEIRQRIRWFTTMLGKLSSVSLMLEHIRNLGCNNYAVTDLVQGNRTRRWAVGWSWLDLRPHDACARDTTAIAKSLLPSKTEVILSVPASSPAGSSSEGLDRIGKTIDLLMSTTEGISWIWKPSLSTGVGQSPRGNVWSRRARRQRQREQSTTTTTTPSAPAPAPPPKALSSSLEPPDAADDPEEFTFKISVRAPAASSDHDATKLGGVAIHVRWLKGSDAIVFESFAEMLRRHLLC